MIYRGLLDFAQSFSTSVIWTTESNSVIGASPIVVKVPVIQGVKVACFFEVKKCYRWGDPTTDLYKVLTRTGVSLIAAHFLTRYPVIDDRYTHTYMISPISP